MKVLNFPKDYSCFNTFNFMKNNSRSSRLTTHLNLVIQMFAQKFYSPTNFLNNQNIKKLKVVGVCHAYDALVLFYYTFGYHLCFSTCR